MSLSRRSSWSLAVPLLALAGLFAMHGLGDHTVTHPTVHESVAGDAAANPATGPATGATTDVPILSSLSDSGLSSGVLGLCVAVLLVGVLAALIAGRAHRRTPWAVPRHVRLRAPTPRSRAPDPPTPLLLSVCRC